MIFLSVMTNNQMKCGIIYKKTVMQVGDDEQMINYEWLNILVKVWLPCIDHVLSGPILESMGVFLKKNLSFCNKKLFFSIFHCPQHCFVFTNMSNFAEFCRHNFVLSHVFIYIDVFLWFRLDYCIHVCIFQGLNNLKVHSRVRWPDNF